MMNSLYAYDQHVKINLHSNLSSGNAMPDATITALVACTNDYNRGHNTVTLTRGATITEAQVKTLADNGIGIMATTLETASQVRQYYAQGKPYTAFKEVLSSTIIAGRVLLNDMLSS